MPKELLEMVTSQKGFVAPTTIQSVVWPALMHGDDVIGVAKTGSGKTLAYLLPSFIKIKVVAY